MQSLNQFSCEKETELICHVSIEATTPKIPIKRFHRRASKKNVCRYQKLCFKIFEFSPSSTDHTSSSVNNTVWTR